MKITLLGTGDVVGTPKVGCTCPVCSAAVTGGWSRLRTSLLVEGAGGHILIDTSPDLRQQLLAACSPRIDAVVWTHGHYDHYSGYGDFYRIQTPPPVYGAPCVVEYCASFFEFLAFKRCPVEPYTPFEICGVRMTLFEVNHPPSFACGLVLEDHGTRVGYTADTKADLPDASLALLEGVDLLIVDAIVPPDIHIDKHMNYREAADLARRCRAKDWRAVHISHLMPPDLPHLGRDMESFIL